jgi:TPP-dependent 2-oxoacid decarboxylase
MALGSTQSLVKMSTRNIPRGKGDRCVYKEALHINALKNPVELAWKFEAANSSGTLVHTHQYLRRHIPESWNININQTILSQVTSVIAKSNITEKNRVFLGCYAASSGNSVPTFRGNLSVPS